MRPETLPWKLAIALAGALLAGCAAPPATRGDPVPVVTVNRDAPRVCAPGRTYSCIERIGKPVRCICADKESLREVFDPLSTVR